MGVVSATRARAAADTHPSCSSSSTPAAAGRHLQEAWWRSRGRQVHCATGAAPRQAVGGAGRPLDGAHGALCALALKRMQESIGRGGRWLLLLLLPPCVLPNRLGWLLQATAGRGQTGQLDGVGLGRLQADGGEEHESGIRAAAGALPHKSTPAPAHLTRRHVLPPDLQHRTSR